jgi:hypothetical protein
MALIFNRLILALRYLLADGVFLLRHRFQLNAVIVTYYVRRYRRQAIRKHVWVNRRLIMMEKAARRGEPPGTRHAPKRITKYIYPSGRTSHYVVEWPTDTTSVNWHTPVYYPGLVSRAGLDYAVRTVTLFTA